MSAQHGDRHLICLCLKSHLAPRPWAALGLFPPRPASQVTLTPPTSPVTEGRESSPSLRIAVQEAAGASGTSVSLNNSTIVRRALV